MSSSSSSTAESSPSAGNHRKSYTSRNQLLLEIEFNRNREIRFCSRDEFVVVNPLTLWTDLFIRYFVNVSAHDDEDDDLMENADDLLFFVRKQALNSRNCYQLASRFVSEIEVFRKDSRKLPIGNMDIDWEETLYLNLIMHSYEYELTCGIVSRTGSQTIQILNKKCQQVYASPSRRCMAGKAQEEKISYPDIYYSVDNYEDALNKLILKDGESFCMELIAIDKKTRSSRIVLFSGLLNYDPLRNVTENKSKTRMPFRTTNCARSNNNTHIKTVFTNISSSTPGTSAEVAIRKTRTESSCPATPVEQAYDIVGSVSDWQLLRVKSSLTNRLCSLCCCSGSSTTSGTTLSRMPIKQDEQNYVMGRRQSDPVNPPAEVVSIGSLVANRNMGERCKSETDLTEREIQVMSLKDEMGSQKDHWTIPSFTQSFFFWKESKRRSCIPIHVAVTYVTLRYDQIIELLLHSKQEPVLTF